MDWGKLDVELEKNQSFWCFALYSSGVDALELSCLDWLTGVATKQLCHKYAEGL